MTKDCWNLIGVWGDRACGELKTHTHCRNCPIYSTSGRNLLEREAPTGYITEWTQLLAQDKKSTNTSVIHAVETISVVIFRLGVEWLALTANLFKEVTQVSTIHTLPHRSNSILLGLVNIRGEIQMCISLSALLGIETTALTHQNNSHVIYKRMVVVEKEGHPWVFSVDEIYGVHRLHQNSLRNVPSSISKSTTNYTKGMISWSDCTSADKESVRNVSYIDDELLFYTLNKTIL